jgi:hypothetical protein
MLMPGGAFMFPQEEDCPVPEHLLGRLYRAKPHGLAELVATVPARTRAMLALYCYRRSHLQAIGLAVAASCEECDLEELGAYAGRVLFEKARQAPEKARCSFYATRRNVSLSNGAIMQVVIDQDLI